MQKICLSVPVLGLAAWMALGLMPAAHAQQVVDADAAAAGTDISHAFPGVTLSLNDFGATEPIRSVFDPARASTGSHVFGGVNNTSGDFFYFNSTGSGYYFRADFTSPTDTVSLDFINNNHSSGPDMGRLEAYDANGTLLQALETSSLPSEGSFQTLTITSASGSIASIRAGESYTSGGDIALDHLVFGSSPAPVPEATSLVSLGMLLALGALAFVTQHKKVSQLS